MTGKAQIRTTAATLVDAASQAKVALDGFFLGRVFEITHVEAEPSLRNAAGEILAWNCDFTAVLV